MIDTYKSKSLFTFRFCKIFLNEINSFVAAMLFAVHPVHTEAVSLLFLFPPSSFSFPIITVFIDWIFAWNLSDDVVVAHFSTRVVICPQIQLITDEFLISYLFRL